MTEEGEMLGVKGTIALCRRLGGIPGALPDALPKWAAEAASRSRMLAPMLAAIGAAVFLLVGRVWQASGEEVLATSAARPAEARQKNFAFGIEYVFPMDLPANGYSIAHHYSEIGATWSKFNGPGTFWENIEPRAPLRGVHAYEWGKVDEAIKAMQDAGFLHLTIVIGPRSKWGCEVRGGTLKRLVTLHACTPPKNQYLDDYSAWVRAFVERYDMDGVDDMPGLRAPVRHYEIVTEAQHDGYWQGTVEEYIRVLRISYLAAKKANPNTRIILSGFWFADLFDEGPLTDDQIAEKLDKAPSSYPASDVRRQTTRVLKEGFEFNRRLLEEEDYFDEVEFHLLSHYTAIEGTVEWIRREMRKNGYIKPIWVGDGGALPQIPCHNRKGLWATFSTFNQLAPALYDDGDVIFDVLSTKQDSAGYTYEQVRQWYYKDQACYLAKSLMIEMGLKLAGTNIYTWLDGKPKKYMSGALNNWQIGGLRDGNFVPKPKVGPPRPSFYTYKLIIDKLGNFSDAERAEFGDPGVKAFRFTVAGRPIYAMWYDDGIAQKPGQEEASLEIDLSRTLGTGRARITRIITRHGQTQPEVETASPQRLLLTETPAFIERAASP